MLPTPTPWKAAALALLATGLILGQVAGDAPQVQPPPFMDGLFPCSKCHDGKTRPDTRRRNLEEMHENIVLNHLGPDRWCLDCHDAKDRDSLHLNNGAKIPFTASYQLCQQCHRDMVDAWRTRRHGRDPQDPTGKGPLPLCVRCHNPHAPRMETSKTGRPEPAPMKEPVRTRVQR